MDFPNTPFGLNAFGRLAFGVTSELYTTSTWLAAYKGEDDTQNIGIDGDICNLMPKGYPSATSNHGTPVYAKTAGAGYQVYDANTPVWTGGRYTRNNARWSEDLTNAVYALAGLGLGSVPLTTLISAGGPNGEDATRIQLDLNGGITAADQSRVSQVVETVEGSPSSMAIWIKSNDTNNYNVLYDFNGAPPSGGDSPSIVAGQSWVKIERTLDSATGIGNKSVLRLRGGQGASDTADILVTGWQQNNLSSVGEYVKTTDAARTVTYSTDANGGALSPHPFLQANAAATNLNTNSNLLSNWAAPGGASAIDDATGIDNNPKSASTVSGGGGGDYIDNNTTVTPGSDRYLARFFIKKPDVFYAYQKFGVIFLSGAVESNVIKFNPDTGDVVVAQNESVGLRFRVLPVDNGFWQLLISAENNGLSTVVQARIYPTYGETIHWPNQSPTIGGAVVIGQVELYENTTIEQVLDQPPIFTTTAAESITETDYTYPADNIDPSNATVSFQMDWAGDNVDVLDIGGELTLSALSPNLILSDGTNSVSVAITEGSRRVTLTLSADTMTLNVDGVAVSGAYIPPAAGLITCKENMWALSSRPNV